MSEQEEKTELDVMAEKYSKKWKVPIEEAKKQVQEFLSKKPLDRTKAQPTSDDFFPDPIGPISKKLQDISQGALASAYAQQKLRELATPPKELETMKEKIDLIEKNISNVVGLVNTTMKDMQSTLEAQKAEREKEALLEEISVVIRPLKEKVESLEKAREGAPGAMVELTPEKIVEASKKMTEEATSFLKARGFNIEIPKAISIEEVKAQINEAVEAKKKEWEEKAGADVEIEKERIRATEEILNNVTDRIFNIFLEPIRDKIHEAIEKGTFQRRA